MSNVWWCGGTEQRYESKNIWPKILKHVMAIHQTGASLTLTQSKELRGATCLQSDQTVMFSRLYCGALVEFTPYIVITEISNQCFFLTDLFFLESIPLLVPISWISSWTSEKLEKLNSDSSQSTAAGWLACSYGGFRLLTFKDLQGRSGHLWNK